MYAKTGNLRLVQKINRFLILNRVGGGDTFTAGLIYGLNDLDNDREALEFAVAASCFMRSIPDDLPLLSVEEVKSLIDGAGSGRVVTKTKEVNFFKIFLIVRRANDTNRFEICGIFPQIYKRRKRIY